MLPPIAPAPRAMICAGGGLLLVMRREETNLTLPYASRGQRSTRTSLSWPAKIAAAVALFLLLIWVLSYPFGVGISLTTRPDRLHVLSCEWGTLSFGSYTTGPRYSAWDVSAGFQRNPAGNNGIGQHAFRFYTFRFQSGRQDLSIALPMWLPIVAIALFPLCQLWTRNRAAKIPASPEAAAPPAA